MANVYLTFLLFTLNLLVLSAAYGRGLENTNMEPVKVKVVSRATAYTGKTNYSDVLGLREITDAFPLLAEDNPDPCLPPQWSWIECNSDAQPRIIALNLYNKGLVAYIVPDFSSMDALQRIDLHRNSFFGEIPAFLGTFPDLQELNLAYNLFGGYLPDSIACNKKLKLRLEGNALLMDSVKCPVSTSSSNGGRTVPLTSSGIPVGFDGDTTTVVYTPKKKSNTPAIVGGLVSAFSLISIAVGIFAIFRHKAKTAEAIAAASAQKPNMPTEEIPMNTHPTPTNMSPQC